jgi:hypothetical protein
VDERQERAQEAADTAGDPGLCDEQLPTALICDEDRSNLLGIEHKTSKPL